MRSTLAQAIRAARLASGLTQEQLGRSLGLKGRAVYRWERDATVPRRRYRRALVMAISAVNQAAATTLATVFANDAKGRRGAAPSAVAVAAAPVAAPASPVVDTTLAFDLAVFALADELDVPARRLRSGLSKWITRMAEASITLEVAQRRLEENSRNCSGRSGIG